MAQIGQYLKKSRQEAGMTQVSAADKLPIDLRTLQRYEQDELRCPWELIPTIADVYQDDQLEFKCIQECPPWKEILPKVEEKPLSQVACALSAGISDAEDMMNRLLKVAADGRIGTDEQATWDGIRKRVFLLTKACMEVLNAEEG